MTTHAVGERVDGRSEHVPKTRQALVDAALRLFARHGYDATTVGQIAEAVGVSQRTFFRYFETKDRVLFFGGDDFNDALVQAIGDQPAHVPDLHAFEATVIALAGMVQPLKARIRLFNKALQSSPELMGQQALARQRHQEAVAHALAGRRGVQATDADSRLAARLGLLMLQESYEQWLEGDRMLGEVIAAVAVQLRATVADSSSGR